MASSVRQEFAGKMYNTRTLVATHAEAIAVCAIFPGHTGHPGSLETRRRTVSDKPIVRLASIKNAQHFREHLDALKLSIPCDTAMEHGPRSPLLSSLERVGVKIGNRIAINPMEGWDGTPDGHPSEHTFRRWQKFGQSGAKLIWGGEAVAVTPSGRANPNQLVIAPETHADLAKLRATLIEEHRKTMGSDDGLLIGLQLTHSGRYCRPYKHDKPEPRILYRHPILDRRLNLPADHPVLTDIEIEGIIEDFVTAARAAPVNWVSTSWTSSIATVIWGTNS